jgi:hypothetical protein
MAAAVAWHNCGQPDIVEARNPARHGVAGVAADKLRSRRVIRFPEKHDHLNAL